MGKDVYDELMELLGWEPEEARDFKPELKEGLKKLLVQPEDVKLAVKERLPKYFTLDSPGMRWLLRIWLRDFVRLGCPTPEEKDRNLLIGGIFPNVAMLQCLPFKVADPAIQIHATDWVADHVGEVFFHVGWKYAEAAERAGVGIEQISCSLNKMRIGLHVLGIIPPSIQVIGRCLCDDAPNSAELINTLDGSKSSIAVRVRDTGFEAEMFEPLADEYFAKSLERSIHEVEGWTGVKITPQIQAECVKNMFKCFQAMTKVIEFFKEDPVPLNGNDSVLFNLPLVCPLDVLAPDYMEYYDCLNMIANDCKERVDKGIGVVPKGTPRIASTIIVPFGQPDLVPMFHEAGCSFDFSSGALITKKIGADTTRALMNENLYKAFAEYYCAGEIVLNDVASMHRTQMDQTREFKIDGWFQGLYRPCRCLIQHHYILSKWMEKEGIPSIAPSCDLYMDRDYPPEKMRTMIETFAEVVKRSKAEKEKKQG